MYTIKVYEQNGNWVAEFPKVATEVYSLFGTLVIPTPFTVNAFKDLVVSTIQKQNPNYNVKGD